MWVAEKFSENPGVIRVNEKPYPWESYTAPFEPEISFLKALQEQRSSISNTQFSLPSSGFKEALPSVHDFDIINLHWTANFISIDTIKKLLQTGKPVVWSLHDTWPLTGGCHYTAGCNGFKAHCSSCPQITGWFKQRIAWEFSHKALLLRQFPNLYIVDSTQWSFDLTESSTLFQGKPHFKIPYGIETEIFNPDNKALAKVKLGLDLNRTHFVFAASNFFEARKGFSVLRDALDILTAQIDVEELNRIEFVCVGHHSDQLKNSKLRIRNLPYVKELRDLADIYKAADFYVLPTLEDCLPNTLTESMACGTIPIAFATGGIPEVIKNDINGLLVSEKTASELSNALFKASRLSGWVRESMSNEARLTIEANHTLELFTKRYIDVYSEIIDLNKKLTKSKLKANFLKAQAALWYLRSQYFGQQSIKSLQRSPSKK